MPKDIENERVSIQDVEKPFREDMKKIILHYKDKTRNTRNKLIKDTRNHDDKQNTDQKLPFNKNFLIFYILLGITGIALVVLSILSLLGYFNDILDSKMSEKEKEFCLYGSIAFGVALIALSIIAIIINYKQNKSKGMSETILSSMDQPPVLTISKQ